MTLIGAFKCVYGAVLLADRQETLQDYAKFDVEKIYRYQCDRFRFLMAGAGDSDTLDMTYRTIVKVFRSSENLLQMGPNEVEELVVRTIQKITKKYIYPVPKTDRPWIATICAVQQIKPKPMSQAVHLFRTTGLTVHPVDDFYFTGNPVLLTRYISDLYFKGVTLGIEEAEALAAYILMEVKSYDPYCGKESDIVILKNDGGIRWVAREDIKYWEEHFTALKRSLMHIPIISCADRISGQVYLQQTIMGVLNRVLKFLASEQKKMRSKRIKKVRTLEEKLLHSWQQSTMRALKADIARQNKTGPKPSTSQT